MKKYLLLRIYNYNQILLIGIVSTSEVFNFYRMNNVEGEVIIDSNEDILYCNTSL
jgi:hypothetical protein